MPATEFGDFDPEDAWDDGDADVLKLGVLTRVVAALRAEPDDPRRELRRVDALRLAAKVNAEWADRLDRLTAIRSELERL